MKRSCLVGVSLAMFAVTLPALQAGAQTTCTQNTQAAFNTTSPCRLTHDVAATVPYLAQMNVSSTSQVSLGTITAAQMSAGYSGIVAGPTMQVAANFNFTLSASAASITGPSGASKATNDLEFASNTTGSVPATGFAGLGSSIAMLTNASATPASSTVYTFFRLKLAWASDKPGTYSSTVTYTLTAP